MSVTTAEEAGLVVRRPGRWGWLFALVWLVYLYYPLRRAWADPRPVWRVVGVVALLLFAVGFAAYFIVMRRRRIDGEPVPLRIIGWTLVGESALLALAAPAAHDEVVAGFVYLAVIAVMSLPWRAAVTVFGALAVLVVVLPRVLPGWANEDGFVLQLGLASFAAFGVGQVIARNAELVRAREQRVDLAVSRERERLARDVHDILGHSLTVITVKSELLARLIEDTGSARARAEVADIEQLARTALADVRATVAGTREVSLAGELVAAQRALDSAGIVAELPGSVDLVPPASRELFAWTLREGITNVVRHAAAQRCTVRMSADALEVVDDGRGVGVGGAGTGVGVGGGGTGAGDGGTGLRGLRARAEAAGARVEHGSLPGGGFRLRVARP